MTHAFRTALLVAAAALAGCSGTANKSTEYRTAAARSPTAALEIPPELTAPMLDDRFAIPDPKTQTAFSTYSRERGAVPAAVAAAGVLPTIANARVERYGDQRWLVVKGDADKIWPMLREFWTENGFTLRQEMPAVGIMETDWAENRAKIPQDIVRRTVGRVFDNIWATSERDRFRTRLEKGTEPGTTEIFVSHTGMQEMMNSAQDSTIWQARPADRELEAEMLGRILVKMGFDDKKIMASGSPIAPVKPGAPPVAEARNAALQNAGAGPLVVNDGFDRAWRRVGLALDRVGFTVEDRDRSKGTFFVRYVDPEAEAPASKEGFLSKLAFWKPAAKTPQPQYRVVVTDAGANMSNVTVQSATGAAETSPTGKKILGLLFDQLK